LYFLSDFLNNLVGITNFIPFPINLIIGIPTAMFGVACSVSANIYQYKHGKVGLIPHKSVQTTELVVVGIYKYSRNPMLFGYIVFLIGIGIILNSIFFLIISNLTITLFVLLFLKLKEEKNLIKRYGDPYLEYKQRTSFIIPWFPKKNKNKK